MRFLTRKKIYLWYKADNHFTQNIVHHNRPLYTIFLAVIESPIEKNLHHESTHNRQKFSSQNSFKVWKDDILSILKEFSSMKMWTFDTYFLKTMNRKSWRNKHNSSLKLWRIKSRNFVCYKNCTEVSLIWDFFLNNDRII